MWTSLDAVIKKSSGKIIFAPILRSLVKRNSKSCLTIQRVVGLGHFARHNDFTIYQQAGGIFTDHGLFELHVDRKLDFG